MNTHDRQVLKQLVNNKAAEAAIVSVSSFFILLLFEEVHVIKQLFQLHSIALFYPSCTKQELLCGQRST